MPEFNLNLILHPAPRQFRIPLPIQRKRGGAWGLSATPSRTTEKKGIPRLSPVTGGANRSRVCTKRAEPWGCPGPQQNKTFKEQKRCAPLFRPGHRLKYRSKAIKTGKTQKNTARFSFFMYTQNHDFARDKTGL